MTDRQPTSTRAKVIELGTAIVSGRPRYRAGEVLSLEAVGTELKISRAMT